MSHPSPSGDTEPGHDPVSVALIEDEPDLLFLMSKVLERAGFDIVGTAADGLEGIELVRERQPDAVVLDLAMPKMDGEQALPTIVKHAPATMVAICSAHLDDERADRLLRMGAFGAYSKSELTLLPALLREDLQRFQRVLDGEDDVPAWARRSGTA